MKREELLGRMGIRVPQQAQVRVIVSTDAKNEADDQFAVIHHLLTPTFDVRGLIAAHFETKAPNSRTTMEKSYRELLTLLETAEIEDVPALRGCDAPLSPNENAPTCEGVELLIEEALREDDRPLYIAVQGALTDVAAALNRCPDIAGRMTVIWIGGGAYPDGGREFNLRQDISAAQTVFASPVPLRQIPMNAYAQMRVTLAELRARVFPCGKIGRYLYHQLEQYNLDTCKKGESLRHGENWCLGDSPTLYPILQSDSPLFYRTQPAPIIRQDMTYQPNPLGKPIRVYETVDTRMLLEDFYAKLALCYGQTDSL